MSLRILHKNCARCGVEKPWPDDFQSWSWCTECSREYARNVYRANPEQGQRRLAASLYRKFSDDPEFWRLVETQKPRRRRIGSRVQPKPGDFVA